MKKGLLFFVFCCLAAFSVCADESDDLIAQMDSQMNFVDTIFKDLEREQLKLEAEKQADLARHMESEKIRTERRLAEQFSGLSGKLSGLPELPKFEGRFQGGLPAENVSPEESKPQE